MKETNKEFPEPELSKNKIKARQIQLGYEIQ